MEPEYNFQNGTAGTISLQISGSVTVKHSKEFKENLIKCLDEKKLSEISLAEVESLDITAIQLLYLLKQEFKAAKRSLGLVAPKNEEITDIIRRAGLSSIFESQE